MRPDAETNATARVLLSIINRTAPDGSPLEYTAKALRAAAHRFIHAGYPDRRAICEAELYALALELAEQVRKARG